MRIQPKVNLDSFIAPVASSIGRIAITSAKGSLKGAFVGAALGTMQAGITVLICNNPEMRSDQKFFMYMMGMGSAIACPVAAAAVGLTAAAITQTTREVFNLCRYLAR